MYEDFYSLKENPFNITADPEFFFNSKNHEEVFAHLNYGINRRKGILVVTGEIGTGKTTICRTFLNQTGEAVKTAFILNPNFSEIELLSLIVHDFGIDAPKNDKLELIGAFNEFLLKETELGNNVAIIIDEAQNMEIPQLEQVRLLSNLETEKQKLLQIILVGQPELAEKLREPALRQLNQRITVWHHIKPLKPNEIAHYIAHRLKVANADKRLMFTSQAMQRVYAYSKGTPRVINLLCERALLAGYVKETYIIDESIIKQSAEELEHNWVNQELGVIQ